MISKRNRTFLAIALAALVIFAWQYFVESPQIKAEQTRQAALARQVNSQPQREPVYANGPSMAGSPARTTQEILNTTGDRVAIDSPFLDGSVALKGAKFDDLRLKNYHETTDPKSPEIVLLAPRSTDYPYYAEFGWVGAADMPSDQSVWKQEGSGALSPGHPVTLTWDNGNGLTFMRAISVDDQYMFSITDSVSNHSAQAETLYPYAYVAREGTPNSASSYILHQGFVGVANGSETDANYSDFKDQGASAKTFSSTGGWVGITDKYWMAAIIPPQSQNFDASYLGATTAGGVKAYQANYRLPARMIAPGGTVQVSHRLFAGAKVVDILRGYEKSQGIARFDNAVDWGWFWFLTQPLFWLLDNFNRLFGSMGIAILAVASLFKAALTPFANRSYRFMGKIKKLEPQIEALERSPEDRQQANNELAGLLKRNGAAPSRLPVSIQVLILMLLFFSIYKVLYVTIEMRQAPFLGWIQDFSARDPTSILNLFGLLSYQIPPFIPAYLSIGLLPFILGLTIWVMQRNISRSLLGRGQSVVLAAYPFFIMLSLSERQAGIVLFYAWYNLLSICHLRILAWQNKALIGDIREGVARVLPSVRIQPIFFLFLMAFPNDILVFIVLAILSPKPNRAASKLAPLPAQS